MICDSCETNKPEDSFYLRRVNKSGQKIYFKDCKSCENTARSRRPIKRWIGSPGYYKERNARIAEERANNVEVERFILKDARGADRKRGRSNDLDLDFVRFLIRKGCIYCGDTAGRMSLDRIDNQQGHTKNNVNPACLRCNFIRRDMPYQAWLCIVPAVRKAFKRGLFGKWSEVSGNRALVRRDKGQGAPAGLKPDRTEKVGVRIFISPPNGK